MKKQFVIDIKFVLTALCLVFLLTVSFYGQYPQSMDAQARQQASSFFSRMYSRCGEYYYFKYNAGKSFLYQCKYAPTVSVIGKTFEPKQLSEADRLNGVDPLPITWEGYARIDLGLCRYQVYSPNDEPGYNAWGPWADKNHFSLKFKKTRAGWSFDNEQSGKAYVADVVVPVNCDEVPSANKKTPVKSPYWDGKDGWANGAVRGGDILKIPANFGDWLYVGRGPMVVGLGSPFSRIFIDGTDNTRSGWGGALYYGSQKYSLDSIAPNLMLGAILIKVGKNGVPIQPFGTSSSDETKPYSIDSNEEIYVAINDSYHADNRGEHIVLVKGNNLNPNLENPPSVVAPNPSLNNIAYQKAVYFETNKAEEDGANCNNPNEVTDGVLFTATRECSSDGVVGFQNNDFNQLMEVTAKIDLKQAYNITKIRYNQGNVQRAETWNADTMTTPFGTVNTLAGTPRSGIWTEQTGTITTSIIVIKFQKTRRQYADDWLFIGEIEVIGTLAGDGNDITSLKNSNLPILRRRLEESVPNTLSKPNVNEFKTPDLTLAKLMQDELRNHGFNNAEVQVFKSNSIWINVAVMGIFGGDNFVRATRLIREIATKRRLTANVEFYRRVKINGQYETVKQ